VQAPKTGVKKLIRFGKSKTESLRALARLLNLKGGNDLALFVIWFVTARERKTVRRMQRQMLSNQETLAAIKAAESGRVTEVSIDDL
jgi:hypothetical protein